MMTIGSEQWRQQAETRWHHLHVRDFDEVRTFRHDCLQEIVSLRPRAWRGVLPWRLHDYEDHSALDATFVAYLDVHLALYDWRQRMFILTHQPLQWWQDRLEEMNDTRRSVTPVATPGL